MITFGEFAEQMALSSERTGPALKRLVLWVVEDAVMIAQGLIGQERPEWEPLTERYVRRKERLGQTGRVSGTDPLLATGEMRDSIEGVAEGLVGVVGSADPRALWHEMGAHAGRGSTIPPRPFLSLAMNEATEAVPRFLELMMEEVFEGPR